MLRVSRAASCLLCLLTSWFGCRPARQAAPGEAMTRVTPPAPSAAPAAPAALRYPDAPRSEQRDQYHGVVVADPYRWLEAMDSPDTRRWIDAENALTAAHLSKIAARAPLERRLRQLWNYERWGAPSLEGSRLVVAHNDGLQNQTVLYTLDKNGERKPLLDANTLSKDGTVALGSFAFSNDGQKMAYGLAEAGSDWQVWRVRDVASATDAADVLHWVKFSGASWSHDDQGFYYSRFDEPKPGDELTEQNYNQKVYYHRLGQPQAADKLIYARPDHKEWGFGATVSEDGRWLVLSVGIGTDPKNSVFVQDLRTPAGSRQTIELLPDFTAKFDFLGNEGDTLWFLTDDSASRRRVIAVDVHRPEKAARRELIAEGPDTIESVSVVGERLIVTWLENAHSKVTIHRLDGSLERELSLPGIGSAG